MGKKITSFLVIVAALLLTLPTQAKISDHAAKYAIKKAAVAGQMRGVQAKVKNTIVLNAPKTEDMTQALQQLRQSTFDKAALDRASMEKFFERNLENTKNGVKYEKYRHLDRKEMALAGLNEKFAPQNAGRFKASARAPKRAAEDLVTPPSTATVETWYTTSGKFYVSGSSGWQDATSYMKNINVVIDGSDIYLQGLAYFFDEAWVKGTIAGSTATFANNQLLGEDDYGPEYLSGSDDGQTLSSSIVFNYDATEGTLKAVTTFIFENSTDDDVAPYTYWSEPTFSKAEPAAPEVVVAPEGLVTEDYVIKARNYKNDADVSVPLSIGFDGNDVYVQGLCSYIPEAWVKGTLSGTTVTFAYGQFFGTYASTYDMYLNTLVGEDVVFTYDATAGTFTAQNEYFLVDNDQYYFDSYRGAVINKVVEIAATPANPAITALKDGNYGWYITFNIPLQDTEGNALVASKLSYEIFTDVMEDVNPLTFTPATHSKLTENLTVIPYGFTENYDFYADQIYLNDLYSATWNKIGIKSIYTGGGETHETAIQWYTIKPYGEPEAETADPVEAPYANALNTADLFAEFGVIDANNDGKTWTFGSKSLPQYSYSSDNDADDWFVSPAVKLEAGKKYHFAIDAYAALASYPERLEVKMGTAPKASALTLSVIPSTDITWATAETLENANVSVEETGYYHFGIHAISDADNFNLYVANFLIEAGAEATAPDSVTELSVVATENKLEATVSFKAPAKAVNGSDLTSNLTKIEILRDGAVIKTFEDVVKGTALQYVDNAEDLTMGTHIYQVIPYNEVGIGVKSEEKSVYLSALLTVPTSFDLSKEDVFGFFQVIDANADTKTWSWASSYGTSYNYSDTNTGDDYLVSPAIKLEAGKNYNVIVKARSTGWDERFEVKVGKVASAEGLNITAIEPTDVTGQDLADFEGEFNVAEEGTYFVAIHAISDPDQFRLVVDKLSIEVGASPEGPAAVADFVAAPGAEGAIEANISFTAPTKAINGNALTEALTKVEILRDDAVVKTFENVAIGSAQSWKDENVEQGKTYTYQVIPYNAAGRGTKSEKKTVFIGVDVPGDITGISVLDQQTKVTFNWDAVTIGQNGGYVNPAQVEYIIWSTAWEEGWFGDQLVLDEKLDSVYATTYTLNTANTDEGTQDYTYWGLQPRNAAGEGNASVAALLTGAPYELPFGESFAGKAFHSVWDYDNVSLYIYNGSSDDDGVALNMQPGDELGAGYLITGKLNLNSATNPTLLFDGFSDAVGKLSIIGFKSDNEPNVLLSEVPFTNQFSTVKVPLTSIKDNRYSRVAFYANFVNATDSFIIDNIRIVDLYEHNLAVKVKAAKSITAGDSTLVKITVENTAENAAQGYTLKLTAGEKELLNITPEAIPAFSSKEFSVQFKTSIFDEAADIILKAKVEYELDLNDEDDIDETIISVKEPTASAPENFLAKQNDDTIELSWTAPEASAAETTEDFENQATFVPFSLGGITAEEHNGALGDWTLYDGNGISVYGFQNTEFENAYQPAAWQVFNPAGVSENFASTYPAHSGEQYLLSMCPADEGNIPAADHWLISPELPGVAQTLKFFYRVLTDQYGAETFEVLYSTTDNKTTSFTKLKDESTAATDWTEGSYDLPAGTKYFAIRHTSTDIFGLLVDDITFTAGGSAPVSFNIYVDAVKQANTTEQAFSIDVDELVGNHVFGVSAVYANGAESKVVTATVDVVNAIQSIIASGKPFSIYTLDGKLISKQATSLKGLKGAYVIDNKKVVLK